MLGSAVVFGLIVQNLALVLLFAVLWRVTILLDMGARESVVLFARALSCPVLLFSTSKLHADGLFSILFFSGFVFLVEALDSGSACKTALAAVLLVGAFNTRLTGLGLFPLLCCAQVAFLCRSREPILSPRNWKSFAGVMIPVVLLGGQHVLRYYHQYGTVFPDALIVQKEDVWNPFLQIVFTRQRWQVFLYLLLIFPLLILPMVPGQVKFFVRSFRAARSEGFFFLAFVYILALTFTLDYQFRQIRYFATVLPFLYLWSPAARTEPHRSSLLSLCL